MANTKISALPAASTPLAGTEVLPVVQGGITEQVSVANLTAGRAVSVASLTSTGAISGTTGTFSGRISTTVGNNEFALRSTGATTGYNVVSITNTGGDAIFGQENSAGNNLIVGDSAYDTVFRGPSGLAFSANAGSNLHMRLGSTGNLTVNLGNVVIGTSGKGIDFSATAGTGTSELLADYEEGTWTPTGNGVTLTVGAASYVKVGNLVTVAFDVTWPSTANGSAANIGGLPYNPVKAGGAGIGYMTASLELHYNAGAGASSLNVYLNNGTAPTNLQLSTSRVIASCSYLTV